jgi:translation initiation factor 2B subunit (eIF-2B alpha/beta/delta family)
MVGHEKMIFLQDVNDWKNEIIERGKTFVENVKSSRQKAVQVGERFITDGAVMRISYYKFVLIKFFI